MALANIQVRNLDRLLGAFSTTQAEWPSAVHMALREEAQEAFRRSQRAVPVDTGALRSSGVVNSGYTSTRATASIAYGGAGLDYAIYVHELPPSRARHASPTMWKYLEIPVKEYSKGMQQRMMARTLNILKRFSIG